MEFFLLFIFNIFTGAVIYLILSLKIERTTSTFHEKKLRKEMGEIITEFNDKVDIEVDEGLPIVISGGTSLPPGFLELFSSNLKKEDVPFKVTEVRRAINPLTSVAVGLLIRTIADVQTKTIKK